jgi:PAS domain S-box-containing protein
MSSAPEITQDHRHINPLLYRTAERVADAFGADHVRLMFLDDTLGNRRHVVSYAGDQDEDQTVSAALDTLLESTVHGELPAGLDIIQMSRKLPDCTVYIPSADLLQEHGLRTGLCVTLARREARLALFAGRSATGTVYGESEAQRACEILDIAALAISEIAAMLRIVQVKHQCESIMDNLPQLIVLLDAHGHVIRTNLTLEKWNLGKVDAIQGVNVHDMLHPSCNDWDCRLRSLNEQMWQQLGSDLHGEYVFHDHILHRDLHFAFSRYTRSRYEFSTKELAFASLVIEDISRQAHAERVLKNYNEELEQRLQERTLDLIRLNAQLNETLQDHIRDAETIKESEKKYTCLVETTLTGIYVLQNRRLIFCNSRFSDIFGYPHDEIYQQDIRLLFPDDLPDTYAPPDADNQSPDSALNNAVVKGMTRDGITLWLQRTLSRVDCLGEPMMMGNIIDITEQKKLENALSSSHEELRILSRKLMNTQEAERKRIASELHDSIGQSISAVKFSLENALHEPGAGTSRSGGTYLQNAVVKLRDTMDEVRRISMDLRPSMLDDLGLIATINWFCRDLQSLIPGIEISKQIEAAEEEIPADLKIVIFRIIQEALNNTVKHAHAAHARIHLKKADDTLELLIEDDGQGFVMETESEGHGFGLDSMRERASLSGGRMTIVSTQGSGTSLHVFWGTEDSGAVTG